MTKLHKRVKRTHKTIINVFQVFLPANFVLKTAYVNIV